MTGAARIAPQTELFIRVTCDELRPEYRAGVNPVQQHPELRNTRTNVSLTFVQKSLILDDYVMRPALLYQDKRCSQDPVVHRAAAKLATRITNAEGILSCLTLGWWTQYSDRAGRKVVFALSIFTVFITDLMLLLVASKAEVLPGGYRLLILGGFINGLTGGLAATTATCHAYIADYSSPSARSRIFSYWTGCIFAGKALGPSLGSLLTFYSNDLLSVFYVSAILHFIYLMFMGFVIPESLSDEARATARELYEADMKHYPRTILGFLWRLKAFVRPLGVFMPGRLSVVRRRARDWNLVLVGIAATAVAINVGSYQFQYQYTIKAFSWNSVQLGYWLSLVGFCRAFYLLAILPIILKSLYARDEQLFPGANSDDEKEAQVRRMDLLVARSSVLIYLAGYTVIATVTSQAPFIGATIILAFGGGFTPSVQSLALALSNPSAHIARREARAHGAKIPLGAKQEIGRLFGAFAITHSLGAQVVGPALFNAVFGATIGIHPRAFFWLSALIVTVALAALSFICLNTEVECAAEDTEREPLMA
ncbi:unnamed protein product [Rhizoctonia solani]|uniref:MFS general substrate transporter n=1 Tax=Rhizoctonia solani TaxID=456999 RepID=A0A8H3B5T9_9AGAM|nr:unnamed protein product [Rhizoctonia solani]